MASRPTRGRGPGPCRGQVQGSARVLSSAAGQPQDVEPAGSVLLVQRGDEGGRGGKRERVGGERESERERERERKKECVRAGRSQEDIPQLWAFGSKMVFLLCATG
jgi:hypothetical protein